MVRLILGGFIFSVGAGILLYMLFGFEGETYSYKFGVMSELEKDIFRVIGYVISLFCVTAGAYVMLFFDMEQ